MQAAAKASPAASGQTRWTSASSVAGTMSAVRRSSAVGDRAGRRAPHAAIRSTVSAGPSAPASATVPSATREVDDVLVVAARHVPEVGGRDHALAAALAQRLHEPLAAQRVELGRDVVEQHQRRGAALGGQDAALRQQQREQAEALLAARAVGAQLAAGAPEHELVAVRAVAGEAALEVGVGALGELGGQRLGVSARERGR